MEYGTLSQKKRLYNAMNGGAEKLSAHLGEKLIVTMYAVQPVTVVNDGESSEGERLYLLTDDGRAFHSMANGILRSWNSIISIFGEPGEEGITVIPRSVEISGGRRTYVLDVE